MGKHICNIILYTNKIVVVVVVEKTVYIKYHHEKHAGAVLLRFAGSLRPLKVAGDTWA